MAETTISRDDDYRVAFIRMSDGTTEELTHIVDQANKHLHAHLVDNVLGTLRSLAGPTLGYRVDRLEHSLQTATRAHREGTRIYMVIGALLHDVGDVLAPANHSELAAAIVEPYLDAETTWVVRHHGVFQGYHYWDKLGLDRNTRDRYRDSPYFEAAAHFCGAWDQVAFDPDYDTLPLSFFEPMVREVFARPATGFRAD
jgi:predicted HD phosphohydrolase